MIIIILCWIFVIGSGLETAQMLYQKAINALHMNDYGACEGYLESLITLHPQDIEYNQLLGSIKLALSKVGDARLYLSHAIELDKWKNVDIVLNYIEALKIGGDLQQASDVGRIAASIHPTVPQLFYSLAKVENQKKDTEKAISYLNEVVKIDSMFSKAWSLMIDILLETKNINEAQRVVNSALKVLPNDVDILFRQAVSLHHQNLFYEAIEWYNRALSLDPTFHMISVNLGAAYQALGRVDEALMYYEAALPHLPADIGLLNNYGSLLGIMGRHVEEVQWLKKALEVEPNMESALVNLGSYFQDEGELSEARYYFSRAAENNENPVLRLRLALMESPVTTSFADMMSERHYMTRNLTTLLEFAASAGFKKGPLSSYIDRIHFYVVYPGLNDRPLQCLISEAYQRFISDLHYYAKHLKNVNTGGSGGSVVANSEVRRIRVGFMSKYFGVLEPHGLLLDGVMCFLPRSAFEVFVFPVARTDGKPLSPFIVKCADHVLELSLSMEHAVSTVSQVELDILVFGDVLSEPMNHFLAYSRLAAVQVAFWGNPVTSCSPHMDYFVSADSMEFPFRTRLSSLADPYSEQVILLEGQGIWYFKQEDLHAQLSKTGLKGRLAPPATYSRADFGLSDSWFVFFCPQSVFKMHPLFDHVFADLLRAHSNIHIVITGGRRQRWSDVYAKRLGAVLGGALGDRMHMIPRVSSERFPALLRMADVILHPFPFDGSRTALDSLEAGIPYVTLPSEYLRGRMGLMYYRTMNVPELVAKNRSDYIRIAVQLATDRQFKEAVTTKILSERHLLWEDMDVPFGWTQFLSRVGAVAVPGWAEFISNTGRNVEEDTALRLRRAANQRAFDETWGQPWWMLQSDGRAELPAELQEGQVPAIFRDWGSHALPPTPSSPQGTPSLLLDTNISFDSSKNKERSEKFLQNEYEAVFTEFSRLEIALHSSTMPQSQNDSAWQLRDECAVRLAEIQIRRGYCDDALWLLSDVLTRQPGRNNIEATVFFAAAAMCLHHETATKTALDRARELALASSDMRADLSESLKKLNQHLREGPRNLTLMDMILLWMGLPAVAHGGDVILALSAIKWTDKSQSHFHGLQKRCVLNGILDPSLPLDFMAREVRRVQGSYGDVLGLLLDATQVALARAGLVVADFIQSIVGPEKLDSRNLTRHSKPPPQPQVVLVQQYCQPSPQTPASEGEEALRSMQLALFRNLVNPLITRVLLLTDLDYDFSLFPLPTAARAKLVQHVRAGRLVIRDVIELVDKLFRDQIVILAHTGTYFDYSLYNLIQNPHYGAGEGLPRGIFISLSSWRETVQSDSSSSTQQSMRLSMSSLPSRHVAWIFRTPLSTMIKDLSAFDIDIDSADASSTISSAMRDISNSSLTNAALRVRAIELGPMGMGFRLLGTSHSLSTGFKGNEDLFEDPMLYS